MRRVRRALQEGLPAASRAGINVNVASTTSGVELVATNLRLSLHIFVNRMHICSAHLEIYGSAGLVVGLAGATNFAVVPGRAPGGKDNYVSIVMGHAAQHTLEFSWHTPTDFRVFDFSLAANFVKHGHAGTGRHRNSQNQYYQKSEQGSEHANFSRINSVR